MDQILRYWLDVWRRAWAGTLAANNWNLQRIARRVAVFLAFTTLLIALGGLDLIQNKAQLALLSLAAIAVVFFGEFVGRAITIPARMHEDQCSIIELHDKRKAEAARNEEAFADLEAEFQASRVLQEHIRKSSSDTDLVKVRQNVKSWDEQVCAKLKKYAPAEVFAFSSIVELPPVPAPINLGFVVLGTGDSHQTALNNFLVAKRGKLRRILMRLEGKTIEPEEA